MATKRKPKSKGLGDTIEKITEATGIKKAVEFLMGDDCGCDERKEKLNKLFPYNKPNCLTEEEYLYLKDFLANNNNRVKPSQQKVLITMYSRVFNVRQEPTNCDSCWRDIVGKLTKVYNEYEIE